MLCQLQWSGLLITTLLQIYQRILHWIFFENWLRFDRIVATSLWSRFFHPPHLALTLDVNFFITFAHTVRHSKPGARVAKYLTIVLRLSYDNAKVTIDLRRTSHLQNTKNARLFSGTIHLQNREIVRDSVLKLTGDIHTGSLAHCKSLS